VHPIEKHSRATPTRYLDHMSFSSVSFATFEKIQFMKTTRDGVSSENAESVYICIMHLKNKFT